MRDESTIAELEHQSQVADAELGVAEELSWGVAAFAAMSAHLKWEAWLLTGVVAVGGYVLSVYRYRKRAARAADNYHRASGIGKYAAFNSDRGPDADRGT